MSLFFFDQGLHIKEKGLVVRPKQEAVPNIYITGLELNTPRSRLVHMLDWKVKVMLWLIDSETGDLRM